MIEQQFQTVFQSMLDSLPKRGRQKREMINARKKSQTTRTCSYYKHNSPLPNYYPNKQDAPAMNASQQHRPRPSLYFPLYSGSRVINTRGYRIIQNYFFLFLNENICCYPSLEPSQRDGSHDWSQNMSSRRNMANYLKLSLLPLLIRSTA